MIGNARYEHFITFFDSTNYILIKRILVENYQYGKLTRTMNQKVNMVKPRKNLRKKNAMV